MPERTEATLQKLEAEKKALEEKNKSLAKIIEVATQQKVAASQAPAKAAAASAAAGGAAKPSAAKADGTSAKPGAGAEKALDELKTSMKSIKKQLKESLQGPAEKHEQMKKMVADIQTKMKDIDKVSTLETKLIDIEKKVSEQAQKAPSSIGNLFGGFGAGGRPDAGMPKNAPKNMRELMAHINSVKDGLETRMLNMERRVDSVREKIGRKNLDRLEDLISSKQDISDNMIPRKVREEVEKILSTFSFEVEGMANNTRELAEQISKSNEDVEESLKVVSDLEERADKTEKIVDGLQETSQRSERTLGGLVKSVDNMEKELDAIETDYHLKGVLKTELAKLMVSPKRRPARTAQKKPATRKRASRARSRPAAKRRKSNARTRSTAKRRAPSRPRTKKIVKVVAPGSRQRISSVLEKIEAAHNSGMITDERYERLTQKLKKLEKQAR